MRSKWRCADVDATSLRRIDINTTSLRRYVPAGRSLGWTHTMMRKTHRCLLLVRTIQWWCDSDKLLMRRKNIPDWLIWISDVQSCSIISLLCLTKSWQFEFRCFGSKFASPKILWWISQSFQNFLCIQIRNAPLPEAYNYFLVWVSNQ